jgi:ribosomal protein L37AE/L43A
MVQPEPNPIIDGFNEITKSSRIDALEKRVKMITDPRDFCQTCAIACRDVGKPCGLNIPRDFHCWKPEQPSKDRVSHQCPKCHHPMVKITIGKTSERTWYCGDCGILIDVSPPITSRVDALEKRINSLDCERKRQAQDIDILSKKVERLERKHRPKLDCCNISDHLPDICYNGCVGGRLCVYHKEFSQ